MTKNLGNNILDSVKPKEYANDNSESEIAELIYFLGGGDAGITTFVSIWGYFDESGGNDSVDGKGSSQPVALIAGYYAYGNDWIKFDNEWNVFLAKHNLTHLHATDVFVGKKQALGWTDKQKRQVILEAVAIIGKYLKRGNGQAIIYQDYKEFEQQAPSSKQVFQSPYFTCCALLFEAGVEWANSINYNGQLNYVFESGDPHSGQVLDRYNQIIKSPTEQKRIRLGKLSFADKKQVCGLQAADLLANLLYKEFYRQAYSKHAEPFTREELSILVHKVSWSYESTGKDGLLDLLKEYLEGR